MGPAPLCNTCWAAWRERLAIWDATRLLWLEIEALAPAAGDDGRLEFRFLSADEVRGFAVGRRKLPGRGLGR